MSYNTYAFAAIKNESQIPLSSVTLYHQYSDDSWYEYTWTNIESGQTTAGDFDIGYNTGFIRYGRDHWKAKVILADNSEWTSPDYLVFTLGDDNKNKTIVFSIQGSTFSTPNYSSSQKLNLKSDETYNSWAAIKITNNLICKTQVKLTHKYSDYDNYEKIWTIDPLSDSGADYFIAYYISGFIRFGSDYWNVAVKLNVQPYDNAPAQAYEAINNATSDKGCMLEDDDNGKIHSFKISGTELTLDIKSGACTDNWKTWNGYNTFTFIQIKNEFSTTISKVQLDHQYSSDTKWEQSRAMIAPNSWSDLMVVEYNTGVLHPGLDYWNVYIYLTDGTWYQNNKANKECYLTQDDTKGVLTFTVSKDKFNLGLLSGACNDSINYKGVYDISMGRNVNLPYNQNAFIGSHNAYANFATGFWYAQQSRSIADQLEEGYTTLLLDIESRNGDIFFIHEGIGLLQPFSEFVSLATVLTQIRTFLTSRPDQPVTIIFEDNVVAADQPLIRQAFETSGTWDMVFNAKEFDVDKNGWPTLTRLTQELKKPIVVFTSNRNSLYFPFQWNYMSENVFGDESLDTNTWLNPRPESQPLNQMALCALNHFPTWTLEGFWLTTWIANSKRDNAEELVNLMIDACYTRYNRYPNWINADFCQLPVNAMLQSTIYLNRMLQGLPAAEIEVQHNRILLQNINYEFLIAGEWKKESIWMSEHLDSFLLPVSSVSNARSSMTRLNHFVNLSLIMSLIPSNGNNADVENWKQFITSKLIAYCYSIEDHLLQLFSSGTIGSSLRYTIPFFLLEKFTGNKYRITHYVENLVHHQIPGTMSDHDSILLAALAGSTNAANTLREKLIISKKQDVLQTESGMVQAYDLTHEILYGILIGEKINGDESLLLLLESLMHKYILNLDLVAELLTCYWLIGGSVNDNIRQIVRLLKEFSYNDDHGCIKDIAGKCNCSVFKDVAHHKLTMTLALSTTLLVAGEVLESI